QGRPGRVPAYPREARPPTNPARVVSTTILNILYPKLSQVRLAALGEQRSGLHAGGVAVRSDEPAQHGHEPAAAGTDLEHTLTGAHIQQADEIQDEGRLRTRRRQRLSASIQVDERAVPIDLRQPIRAGRPVIGVIGSTAVCQRECVAELMPRTGEK